MPPSHPHPHPHPHPRTCGLVVALVASAMASACQPVKENPPRPSATATPTLSAGTTVGGTPTTATAGPGPSLEGRSASLSLPSPRYRTAGAAIGSIIYVLGGFDAAGHPSPDVYRIQTTLSGGLRIPSNVALAGHLSTATAGGAAVASGSRVLMFGGTFTGALNTVALFDPATGTTTEAGLLPHPRSDASATQVGNEIIVLGGFDGTAAVPDILATSDGTSFHAVGKLATPVRGPAVAVVGTTVFVFGGVVSGADATGTFSSSVQAYNITTGRTRVVGTLPAPLAHARAAVLGDQVYVLGGRNPGGPTAAIQRFDTRTGALTPAGTLPRPVADAAAATIGGTVFLAGGMAATALTDIESVTPRG